MNNRNRYFKWGITFAILLVFGTPGYTNIEGWSCFNTLYVAAITIISVGYSEVHPLSTGGRIFNMILSVSGVGAAFYMLTGKVQANINSI